MMRRSLVFYFVSEIFLSLGIGFFQYAQPFYYAQNGVNDRTIGLILGVNSFAGGLCAFFLGSIADRIGASRIFKVSTLVIGIGYLLTAVFTRPSEWIAAAAVGGLGGALLMSTENVVLSSLSEGTEKADILSKFVALYTTIIGIGSIVAGVVAANFGYHRAIEAAACLALVAPCIRIFVKAPDVRSLRFFRLPPKRLLWMSGYSCLFGIAGGLFTPFATLILHGTFHWSPEATSSVYAISTFMISVGSFFVTAMLRRLRRRGTLLLSFSLVILSAVLTLVTGNPWIFAALFFVRTVFGAIPGPIVDATFLDLSHKSEFSQMFGVRVFGSNLGIAIGTFAGGSLLNHREMGAMYFGSALMYFVAICLLLFLLRVLRGMKRRTRWAQEARQALFHRRGRCQYGEHLH